ncbi:MAG TPA: helix-turn-helix transcriptional regulator [Gammaproteobacteria bacterium]
MPIVVNVDVMLARRKMRLNELAERVGITPQNLSVLKTGRARAIRFSTLEKLCEVLDCQPGDLFAYEPAAAASGVTGAAAGPESDGEASSSADALTAPPSRGSMRGR